MDRADQQQMVDFVNADGIERATLLVVPGADHNFGRHFDLQSAFDHGGEGGYPAEVGQKVVDFIRQVSASADKRGQNHRANIPPQNYGKASKRLQAR